MIFYIYNPFEQQKTYYRTLQKLFTLSLLDLGHIETKEDRDAELIITLGPTIKENIDITNKKSILIQTKDQYQKFHKYIDLRHLSNHIWGLDINNPFEDYIYLGYHPFFDLTQEDYEIDKDVVFLGGGFTPRRKKIIENNNISLVATWDDFIKIRKLREYKINTHFHALTDTPFTPWDRLTLLLSNKIFSVIEECYIPKDLSLLPLFKYSSFDTCINQYLDNPLLRQQIAEDLYQTWKTKFDMRDLLEKKLADI